MSNEIEAGYGYVLIDTPEKKKKFSPKRIGDEHWTEGGWNNCHCFTEKFWELDIYRRRIEAGEGWEIVPEGEKEARDMQYTRNGTSWFNNTQSDFPLREKVGAYLDDTNILAFRRRKQPQAVDGWIKLSERLPKANKPLFACNAGEHVASWYPTGISHPSNLTVHFTHWMPSTVPTPPKPEPTEAEQAWSEYLRNYSGDDHAKQVFIAGYEAAKKGASK